MEFVGYLSSRAFGAGFVLFLLAFAPASSLRACSPNDESLSADALHASLEKMAAGLTATLKPWPVPHRVFKVADFGAIGDGKTVNSAAIQRAIDACSAQGGGVVLIEKGDYVTGTIDLKDGVLCGACQSRVLVR